MADIDQFWISVVVGVLPIVVGGGLYKFMDKWTYNENELDQKITLVKANLTERLRKKTSTLLRLALSGGLNADKISGASLLEYAADAEGEWAEMMIGVSGKVATLEKTRYELRSCWSCWIACLFLSIGVAATGTIGMAVNSELLASVTFVAAFTMILMQAAIMLRCRWASNLFNQTFESNLK